MSIKYQINSPFEIKFTLQIKAYVSPPYEISHHHHHIGSQPGPAQVSPLNSSIDIHLSTYCTIPDPDHSESSKSYHITITIPSTLRAPAICDFIFP